MSSKVAKFIDGERILCFHGPLMYEAKCIKVEIRENKNVYLIHYNGWNKHWDEWVPESRVLKYNDTNLRKQKDLLKQHGKDKAKRGKPSKIVKADNTKEGPEKLKRVDPIPPTSESKRKKSRIETYTEIEDASTSEVEINIPDALKPVLLDDWDLVVRQKKLYHLPAKMTVEDILKSYTEKSSGSIETNSTLQELTSGIKEYFNVMLGSQLLYKFERSQYQAVLEQHPELTMSQIYGISHLLRFFVKIGSLLSFTNLNEKNMAVLAGHMQKFIDYLQNNITTLFDASDYENLSTDHHKTPTT